MSYIEFIGTILYLWSVWLIAKKQMLTWPVSIVSVLLYMALFYQIPLYSDTLEQVYYLGASVYGWWRWSASRRGTGKAEDFRYSSRRSLILVLAVTIAVSFVIGAFMSRVHCFLPCFLRKPLSPIWMPNNNCEFYSDMATSSKEATWLFY